ncbi:hypothetical protein B7463_g2449, partial [Scytalidium lignicola]
MHSFFSSTILLALTFLAVPSQALWANLNTQCATQCGNTLGGTSGEEIPCNDADYSSGTGYGGYGSSLGPTFVSCINCQLSSNQTDSESGLTDLQLGLYNLRYAVSWCVFGYPNNTDIGTSPCATSRSCGLVQSAFEFDALAQNTSAYGYCADLYTYELPNCQTCLSVNTDQFYINNFVTALDAACIQTPAPGHLLSIQGTVFSNVPVNITNPSSSLPSLPSSSHHGPLSLGEIVGVVVAGVVLILVSTGFCIVCRGRRRRRAEIARHQRESGYAKWFEEQQMTSHGAGFSSGNVSAGGFFDSPQSQRPLHQGRPWADRHIEDESPASAMGEKAYFSPYTSQYTSPVSGLDAVQTMQEWPLDRKGSFSGAGDRDKKVPEPEPFGERIELQDVKHASPPPVLAHPGYGRQFMRNALTEDDARRGDAL